MDDERNLIKNNLAKIRNKYLLQSIFKIVPESQLFQIIKYNKSLQNRVNIGINDYKDYKKIIIEIYPKNLEDKNKFINIPKENKAHYHIYYNDEKKERKKTYFKKDKNITKVKVIIDKENKSLSRLFYECKCIEKINFIRFNIKDIYDMSDMFYGCSSLIELNLNNFNTNNVIDMKGMFSGCSLLKKLNLSNFNTYNVTSMENMFSGCSSLKELNIKYFYTLSVVNMNGMFSNCSSLKQLSVNSLDAYNVYDMRGMLYGCSKELIDKILIRSHNLKSEAFP